MWINGYMPLLFLSTVNENMPLRDLLYLGRTLEKILDNRTLYKRKLVNIPTPEFFVFYNGDDPQPPEKVLHLSDAYLEKMEHPMLELEVKVININLPSGHKLLEQWRPMYEYSWFIQQIKSYLWDGLTWEAGKAIGKAIGLAEGKAAGIAEGKAAGIAEGKAVGMIEGDRQVIYNFLEHLGKIPEDIQKRIEDEQDRNTLKKWYMAAPGAKSFKEFRESMGIADK